MDDWQEAALSNRHLHNRRGQNVRGKAGKGANFDVHRTFGTYELKCPAAEKIIKGSGDGGRLEVFCLNESQNALYAKLNFPGLLDAVVVLAGSRRVMNTVLRGLIERKEDDSKSQADPAKSDDGEENEDDAEDEDEDEELESQRAKEFEKNSFRSPKFWLRWQGQLLHETASSTNESEQFVTDSGYLVFSGNVCDKFEGTISCDTLGWDNVKLRGWKTSTKSARNFDIGVWHED